VNATDLQLGLVTQRFDIDDINCWYVCTYTARRGSVLLTPYLVMRIVACIVILSY